MQCPTPCRHFRNKKMFISTQAASALSLDFDPNASAYCWCNKTMTEIGTDDELVNLCACADACRACYEPR
jgi:hypothetical protein